MVNKRAEKGQALILIAFAAIVLFAFAALAIDGSRVYSTKRHAQNAADTAALAGALAYTRATEVEKADAALINGIILDAAELRATSNGYTDGGKNEVTITAVDVPSGDCPGNVDGKDISVKIVFHQSTTFARVFGRTEVTNAVIATSRACGFYVAPLFNGNAIVGLSPNNVWGNCGFDTGNSNSKTWKITGGGVFSNGCMEHPNGTLIIPDDKCATSVGGASLNGGGDYDCVKPNQGGAYDYPEDIAAMMPPNPCTGPLTGNQYAAGGIVPTSGQTTFSDGVYCIADFSTLDAHIVLTNATLYVTDTNFSHRFNGGGDTGFFGYASTAGAYKGYYMVMTLLSKAEADACNQNIDWRGNGNLQMIGTILAPSACMDYRGNSTGTSTHSQMIFYQFSSNGDSELKINYDAGENRQDPVYPTISLLH